MEFLKSEPLEIDENDPFANDVLDRERFAERLTRLVGTIEQPAVLALHAPWGRGKSTFVQMWQQHLRLNGHLALLFNAWESDFVADPLVAFIGELEVGLTAQADTSGSKGRLRHLKKEAAKIIGSPWKVAKPAAEVAAGGLPGAALATVELAAAAMSRYSEDKKTLDGFRQQLSELADSFVAERQDFNLPIVVIVDELDRCRPDFAVRLLERIKHLFHVQGLAFVLSLDREQLENAVKGVYGHEIDPDGYLRRFIDYSLELPAPDPERFARFLAKRMRLAECLTAEETSGLVDTFSQMVTTAERLPDPIPTPSLRTQEQCFTLINLAARTAQVETRGITFGSLLAYLSLLRECAKHKYDLVHPGIPTNPRRQTDVTSWAPYAAFRAWLRVALVCGYAEPATRHRFIEQAEGNARRDQHLADAASRFRSGMFDWEIVPKVKAALELGAELHADSDNPPKED